MFSLVFVCLQVSGVKGEYPWRHVPSGPGYLGGYSEGEYPGVNTQGMSKYSGMDTVGEYSEVSTEGGWVVRVCEHLGVEYLGVGTQPQIWNLLGVDTQTPTTGI